MLTVLLQKAFEEAAKLPENEQDALAQWLLSELYTAIGQYLVYRDHMQQMGILETLYLAVPTFAFDDVFQKFGMGVIQQSAIKLIVIDLEQEEIKAWIP